MLKRTYLASAAVAALACGFIAAADAQTLDDTIAFTIEPQSLEEALIAFSDQSGVQVVASGQLVAGKTTQGISRSVPAHEALAALLRDTGLGYRPQGDATVSIVRQDAVRDTRRGRRLAQLDQGADRSLATDADGEDGDDRPEEIIITGTNIRGVQNTASPLTVIDREDIDRAGYATVQELIRNLPQNLDFGEGTAAGLAGDTSGANPGVATVNIRGLGVGATLTLINGRRLAFGGLSDQYVDISLIPLTAVERVEILTDGASAVYGTDAVAGVVNFILKDDFDGAETRFRFGGVTEGATQEYQVGQTVGRAWDSGNILVAYEYYHRNNLDADDRRFSETAVSPSDLLPRITRHSVLATARQSINDSTEVFADFSFSSTGGENRSTPRGSSINTSFVTSDSEQYNAAAGGRVSLWSDWQAEIFGGFSVNDSMQIRDFVNFGRVSRTESQFQLWTAEMRADGSLFEAPGGTAKLALGGQYRAEDFTQLFVRSGTLRELDRNVAAAFGEIFVPLVGPDNRRAWIEALELTLAGRFEDFSDFGSTTNPKVGLRFAPTVGLSLRSTYGTSFKAPTLLNIGGPIGAFARPSSFFIPPPGTISAPAVLVLSGANEDLQPEESEMWTFGFDYSPTFFENFEAKVTYFDIVFDGRIDTPGRVSNDIFTSGALGDLLNPNASTEEISSIVNAPFYDNFFGVPISDIGAIADVRFQNLAASEVNGFDFSLSYATESPVGYWSFGVNGSYLLEFIKQSSPTAVAEDIVDTAGNPIDLRLRANTSWTRGGATASIFVNYADSYTNDRLSVDVPIDSWTTVDLNLSYNMRDRSELGPLNNARLSLYVQNVFDEDPPFADLGTDNGVFFDGFNATGLGRFVAVQLEKRF